MFVVLVAQISCLLSHHELVKPVDLGFGQMVSKLPYWENSVRDWRLPFAETPPIYEKICKMATANENVTKQKTLINTRKPIGHFNRPF